MPLQAIERYLTEILLSLVLVSAIALGPGAVKTETLSVGDVLTWVSSFATSQGPSTLPSRGTTAVLSCAANHTC